MKTAPIILSTIAIIAALTATPAFSQGGPLTPPVGAPAPTMKSLDQIEPRRPLVSGSPGVFVFSSGQITISQPGSYYLTGNMDISANSSGIIVEANGVTVDLMGYSIRYTGDGFAGNAISVRASNVTIQNGHILSTTTHDGSTFTLGGFDRGVFVPGSVNGVTLYNSTVRNLSVRGTRGDGIILFGRPSMVENCTVSIAGGQGIYSHGIAKNCYVQTSGSSGISGFSILDCRVDGAVGNGITANIVANSRASSLGGSGIKADTVTDSQGQSSSTSSSHRGIDCINGTVNTSDGNASGGHGIIANIVNSSRGRSSGTHGTNSCGINATTVTSSMGSSVLSGGGHGISADHVTGSYGFAGMGARNGIQAFLATHSYGSRGGNETDRYGISSTQANGCLSQNGENITNKYNMP